MQEMQEATARCRDGVRHAVDRAIERLRDHGGWRNTAPPRVRPAPPAAVDLAILTAAQASAADAGISVAGKLVWLRLVADQLPKIGDELQDLIIALDVTHQLMSEVPETNSSDYKVISHLRETVISWRRDLVTAGDRINDYMTDITVGLPPAT